MNLQLVVGTKVGVLTVLAFAPHTQQVTQQNVAVILHQSIILARAATGHTGGRQRSLPPPSAERRDIETRPRHGASRCDSVSLSSAR